MSLATYEADVSGHYALNYASYSHFTSPIRRYPDLLVHRVIKSLIKQNEVIEFDTIPPTKKHNNTTFIRGSILDKALVAKAMKGVDIVYHFAAMTDLDTVNSNPASAIEINIAGTTNILESCIEAKIKRLRIK